MVRLEYFSKSLGWRMLLLLFWTVFVCAVLYASKGSQVSDLSKDYFKRFSSRRWKRVADNSTRRQYECKAVIQKPEDLDLLDRLFNSRRRERPTVHCSVVSPCEGGKSFQADCFSRQCSVYKVRVQHGNHVISSLSNDGLSRFVEARLQENSFMTVEDLNWYVDIQCKEPIDSYMKITGDILLNPHCHEKAGPGRMDDGETDQETTVNRINILYFRFLSEWEFSVRFPGLFSLITKHAKGRNVTVMDFKNYQATRWGDDEILALLLQGRIGPFMYSNSVLNNLHTDGSCFRLEDFSCSRSRQQEILVANVTSSARQVCDIPSLPQKDTMMENMCTEGNLTDAESREMLTSLLSHIHDVDSTNGDLGLMLTMSILNTKDFKNSEVLDYALVNFFNIFLGQKRRAVLLMSGVGNPTLLRFDQSVRLQTQASNPVLRLLTTSDLAMNGYDEAVQLQRSSFSMLQLHHFLKLLTRNESSSHTSKTDLLESYDSDGSDSCGMLNVKPPFTCLCEGQFVKYENDSLMAGFAEFAVSIINSQLRQFQQGSSDQSRYRCAKLSGHSFTNVRVGFYENKRRILMDIYLENELYKDKVLRGVLLDVWDTDKIPQAELQLFKADPLYPFHLTTKAQSDSVLKTLCQTGERLEHHTSSETGLMKRWSQERHLGRSGRVTHVHDSCLYLFVRDFGDSISVEMANVCKDRRYDVMVHLSLMNMISLSRLPLSASLGHVQREVLAVVVKVSYTVPTFAYKLHPDFDVNYDD